MNDSLNVILKRSIINVLLDPNHPSDIEVHKIVFTWTKSFLILGIYGL